MWAQTAYLKASNTDMNDGFGNDVALDGDTIAVGAHGEDSLAAGVGADESDDSGILVGAAYVFLKVGAGWVQEAYVKPSNPGSVDKFGQFLALQGDRLVVCGPEEDSLATGVGGDQGDAGDIQTGAVYVFDRTGTLWAQTAYVKASNTEAFDVFGSSVDFDGTTMLVGAAGEDSDSPGVNGDQSINAAFNSGAVYAFELDVQASATYRNVVSNPPSYTAAAPVLGSTWTASVDLSTTGHSVAWVFGYAEPATIPLGGGQTVLVFGTTEILGLLPSSGTVANFSAPVPADPSLCGFEIFTQAAHFGGVFPFALSNAQDLVVGI